MNRFALIILFAEMFAVVAVHGQPSYANSRPADFPTPSKTDNFLFFIQRNRNKNTVVYDAQLQKNGTYNTSRPLDVYWKRYNSTGERAELTWLQRNFAFGYDSKKDNTGKGFWVTLTAYDGRKIHLEKTSDGKPVATITINGKYCRLTNIWVFADESGKWPKVLHVDLHGKDMLSGKTEFERIYNK